MNVTDPAVMQESPAVYLSDAHRAYLNEHAISENVIAAARIRSEGDDIVFPWADNDLLTEQRRVWPEPEDGLPPGAQKYRWVTGESNHLAAWRPLDDAGPDAMVIIAEGTKQSLAVASYAPAGCAVYGMPGCDIGLAARLRRAALNRFAGHPVIIMLDADAAENLNVYEAGEKLGKQLTGLEGAASVSFTYLPTQGTDGIDDFLALVPEERRAEILAKLLAAAGPKPAEHKPAHRKMGDVLPDTGGRPMVVVNDDRAIVIRQILARMRELWDGRELFSYGGALTRLRYGGEGGQGVATEPLDKDSLARWVAEAAYTCTYKPPGAASPGTYTPSWPEQQTMGAVLASGDEFAALDRLSRTPFIRPDGSVCAKNGYDPASRTMLVTGNSGMDRLDVPDAPDARQLAWARDFLLGDWLGDFPFRDEASRANALALVLTPFLRGLVPLVPLAVVSGLQPGVGKNLLADCLSLMITGEAVPALPWITDRTGDDENRKQITSAFRAGTSLMIFDEAHELGGTALTRAITSVTYADRILGVSKQAAFPNRVTWLALGNQVRTLADMARRSYYIELYPDVPDPESRSEDAFAHPELRRWTAGNRPELVTAALILIRSWYAAGCPAYRRGTLMGSFEEWDKMMSGILGNAGVPGFLSALAERRAETDTSGGYWSEHLAWLAERFSDRPFTVFDVATQAAASGGTWDSPPGLDDPAERGFARNLGAAYSRMASRYLGQYRLVKLGIGHRKVQKWQLQPRDDSGTPSIPSAIPPIPPVSETLPDLGGRDPEGSNESTSATSGAEGWRDSEGSLLLSDRRVRAGARAGARAHTREGVATIPPSPPIPPQGPVLGFDLETADAKTLFTYEPHDETGFVRLAGVTGPSGQNMITGVPALLAMLAGASAWYGHNVCGFDGLALARHAGLDWDWFCSRARDTELIARQAFPPRSRESGHSTDKLGLDAVAALLGLPGKTDELSRLARKYGGYDQIPLDDAEYQAYLHGDLDATRGVAGQLLGYYDTDPYLPREHALARIAGHMSLNGAAIDTGLLEQRYEEGEQRKQQALEMLHGGWGLPLTKTVTRGRGGNKTSTEVPVPSPLATDAGRDWLAGQWARYQVPAPPLTDTGKLALGSDALAEIARDPDCPADLRAMLALMNIVTTTRTVYQTARDWLAADGRVHPRISFRQASGRWSVTDPGLTVFGKHAGRHIERDIIVASPGNVLLSFDLKQVDMRAMAGHCQDPAYMALFGFGDDGQPLDPHTMIAEQVFGTASRRQDAKAVGHGWNYGLGAKRMIGDGLDPEKVWGFINGMESRFPVLIGWREQIRAVAGAGEILDNGFGRRMRAEPSRAYTVAPALMGQGGARDIMGDCLLRLDPALYKYLILQVHDEIILDVPAAEADEVAAECRQAMTSVWKNVPILCDQAGPGRSWGELSADK